MAVDQPSSTVLETPWQLRAPSGKVLRCTIVTDAAPGFDVRVGYSPDDLIRSQRTAEIRRARELAAEWKQAVLAKGSFFEISDADERTH